MAWNLAASAARGPGCPEPGFNATAPPQDPAPEVEELRRRLAESAQREETLARQLEQAEGVRGELEEALRACENRQVGGQGGGSEGRGRGRWTQPCAPRPVLLVPQFFS